MQDCTKFYIDGRWVDAHSPEWFDVIDPATEEVVAKLALGNEQDVNDAVAAARLAFPEFVTTSAEDRIGLLERIVSIYERRYEEFVEAMRVEMGAPVAFARSSQAVRGPAHLNEMIKVLRSFEFDSLRGTTLLAHEPIGVCGLITPWNWPVNQIVVKIAPALAAGCTMVLKPSEYSPLSALLFAEVLHEAGVPRGVFNLVNGDGSVVGAAIAAHPDIDMVSFTGSTRGGVAVAKAAADTVKRVGQELGGKSANILVEGVDLEDAVKRGVTACFANSGQSCAIPTRMLVPRHLMPDVERIANETAASFRVGRTDDESTQLGPLVNQRQFARVQSLIQQGIDEGAKLISGGVGRPEGFLKGYFVKPTIFSEVTPAMTIANEEIFGPVLSIIPYQTIDEAIDIANGTPYGLAAYVQSSDLAYARRISKKLRAGSVHLNYPPADFSAPFGGYKQSGNGREFGEFGLREYLETKSIVGYQSKA